MRFYYVQHYGLPRKFKNLLAMTISQLQRHCEEQIYDVVKIKKLISS